MLPSAQRVFDAARFLVALGDLATDGLAGGLQWLISAMPGSAVEAYQHARHQALHASDPYDRDLYDSVALVIGSNAAIVGVVVD
jgi:hypothetical protein